MVNKRDTSLFNSSGCLSLEAINHYHTGKLGDLELQQVKQHLAECEICTDELDGYTYLPDQRKQRHLVNSIRKKIKSRYSARSFRSMSRRDRKINPTLVYISAAATVLIILGIYGILNTDIFNQDNLVAEQIQEGESERKEIISQVEEPLSETTQEALTDKPRQSDSFEPASRIQEEEIPEETVRITGIVKMEEEIDTEFDDNLALVMDVIDEAEPMDTFIIDEVKDIGGVDAVAAAGESASRKAAAMPAKAVPVYEEKQAKLKMEPADTLIRDLIYTDVDEMPEFTKIGYKDFEEYIQKNLTYPLKAKEDGISGQVLVQFIVDETGKVRTVEIKKGIDPVLDQEAARVINSSPKWMPGKKEGRKVAVQLVYPVLFQL